jgi:N6-L-threonylcarbamoyladenine synthase/ribosomal-protein-alanine N-acetyltransferase
MSWWHPTQPAPIVRLATPADRPAVTALLANTWQRHGMAALEEQAALLAGGASALALADGAAVAFLGLASRPPDHEPAEHWADLTLAAVANSQRSARLFPGLVTTASAAARGLGITHLMCITAETWLRSALIAAEFSAVDEVISYLRPTRRLPTGDAAPAQLRPLRPADTDTVLALNRAAFAPIWRYHETAVLTWLLTADHAVLAEWNGQPVGFALTVDRTTDGYAQLVRVVVHPQAQGYGIGRQLVLDALWYAAKVGASGLGLNTQASNTISRGLYDSLGFRLLGPAAHVLVRRIQGLPGSS